MTSKDKTTKNGRRPRNSPTSHAGLSDDDNLPDNKIHIGQNHQADIPMLVPAKCREYEVQSEPDQDQLVWTYEGCEISEKNILAYVNHAKITHDFTVEQALGMLYWHKFNLIKTCQDLDNYIPYLLYLENDWTEKDERLFERIFKDILQDEKRIDFAKIKKRMPKKTMGSILSYFYTKYLSKAQAKKTQRQWSSSSEMDE